LEVDVQQGNFKILQLFHQVFILFLVEKWIPPTRSKIAEIGQKAEGILGVKENLGFHIYRGQTLFHQTNPGLQNSQKYCHVDILEAVGF
jgi:hypothetical protein